MKTINLILGNHNHQPVGNFDFVIENTYNNAYKPFLDTFIKYEDIKFNFHYTGSLFLWIEKNHPEHIENLKTLIKDGRIELQSGAFYEPILPAIPDRDKIVQLVKLNEYIKKIFDFKPNGAWIAERVWEPTLVKTLSRSNINYTMLDDSQFLTSGITSEDMFGYFTTDDEIYRLNIFPISQNLRYLIPFREVEKSIEYLKSIATEEGDRLAVIHDDGEKYGDWPNTYKWVYDDKWLDKFFTALSKEKDIIKTTTYSEYMSKYPPLSRIYIPTGSYEEMLTWVLPAKLQDKFHASLEEMKKEGKESIVNFMHGGFWRNYFRKYSESNRMHKRMLLTSKLSNKMIKSNKNIDNKKNRSLDLLLQGQCNCPYWHGTFGGLYLNNLRHATYANLISSSAISEKYIYGDDYFYKKNFDFDLDGREEVYISGSKESFVFHSLGGSLIEWDLKIKNPINLIDTLKRREEAYHISAMKNKTIKKEDLNHVSIHEMVKKIDDEIERYLVFDKNEKVFGIDHFIETLPEVSDFYLLRYKEISNFYNSYYKIIETHIDINESIVIFESDGFLKDKKIKLTKKYTIYKKGGFNLEVYIENKSYQDINFVYAMENNITLLAGNEPNRYYIAGEDLKSISKTLSDEGLYKGFVFGMRDIGYIKINVILESDTETTFLYMPNFTISDAVDKLEMNYQNSTIVNCVNFNIKPGEINSYKVYIKAEEI